MTVLFWIILSTFVVSAISFAGAAVLALQEAILRRILFYLVALSSGALLGGAFIHLLPEGAEKMEADFMFLLVLAALLVYFLIEKVLHWHHCHNGGECRGHTFGQMNLIGDGIHNFLDGLTIAAAFFVSPYFGLTATLAIILHEIPQEISDFGVLLYSGFSKTKALIFNFASGLIAVLGGIIGWALITQTSDVTKYLIPIAAAGFIYIALSDLLPELRQKSGLKSFLLSFVFLLLGILIMYLAKLSGVE